MFPIEIRLVYNILLIGNKYFYKINFYNDKVRGEFMRFISTRDGEVLNSSKEAILKGITSSGGLFLPEDIKKINFYDDEIKSFSYNDFAKKIISTVFDDFSNEEINSAIDGAYNLENFSKTEMLEIKKLDDFFVMELFHGKTSAFKDFALSILPQFMKIISKDISDKKIAILTATSGDTGSAALSGFKDVKNTSIIVFYPSKGVSKIQKYQMVSQNSKNAHAIGIDGNFDDAQSALKNIFNDRELREFLNEKGIILSSANSINVGRLVPQVVYYFYTYYNMVKNGEIKNGEEVNVAVPTGNFGNILAAYIAKLMGAPFKNFIVASNKNNVLTDFFNSGKYDANRDFLVTNTPSMDILVSSNLERLLYLKLKDREKVNSLMNDLNKNRKYEISKEDLEKFNEFYGYYLDDEETLDIIKKYYDKYHYLMDTHTAVCVGVAEKYNKEHKNLKTIIASTASCYKFPKDVSKALGILDDDDFNLLNKINEKTGVEIPKALNELSKIEISEINIKKDEILSKIKEILGDEDEN